MEKPMAKRAATKPPTKKRAVANPGADTRGGGISDEIYSYDYGLGVEYFVVDTRINKRFGPTGNEHAFDRFVGQVSARTFLTRSDIRDDMIAFLDAEVDSFGTPPSDALKAKNIFRAAFGAPFLPPPIGHMPVQPKPAAKRKK
jgi:hypothetical protein